MPAANDEDGAGPAVVERLTGVTYYSREQLEDSPSRRDGVSAAQEADWRAEYTAIISEAGMRLRIPQWAIYTAAQLCHRFYAVRSMAHNDRFLISAGCLFLSAKLQEFPKRASDTALACDHVLFFGPYERAHAAWRARQAQAQPPPQPPPQQQVFAVGAGAPPPPPPPRGAAAARAAPYEREPTRWWEDRAHVQQRREELLVAERAVLFALNFSLGGGGGASHPYASLLRWVAELDWRRMARARRRREEEEGDKKGGGGGAAKEGAEEGGGGGEEEQVAAAARAREQQQAQQEEEKRRAAALSRDVLHVAWNLVTDSARTQLALRHHPSKLAAAALYTAALATGTLPLPPLLKQQQQAPGGEEAGGAKAAAAEAAEEEEELTEQEARAAFFRRYGITADELEDIVTEMMDASDALCGGTAAAAAEAAATRSEAEAKRRRVDDGGGGGAVAPKSKPQGGEP